MAITATTSRGIGAQAVPNSPFEGAMTRDLYNRALMQQSFNQPYVNKEQKPFTTKSNTLECSIKSITDKFFEGPTCLSGQVFNLDYRDDGRMSDMRYLAPGGVPTTQTFRGREGLSIRIEMISSTRRTANIRPNSEIVVIEKGLIEELEGDILRLVDNASMSALLPTLKSCTNKLSSLQRSISDLIERGLDEDTSASAEELIEQCNLEIQEIIDGLETV
jgi:hypothetical protein